jgi:hypothetical protein
MKGAWITVGCAFAVAACEPPSSQLLVHRSGGSVHVELRRTAGMIFRRQEPVPLSDCGFYAAGEPGESAASLFPREIWRVTTVAPDRVMLGVEYGVVPEGFYQAAPQGTTAPPLEPGVRYTVECSGDGVGVAQFEIPATAVRLSPQLRRSQPLPPSAAAAEEPPDLLLPPRLPSP